MTDDTKKPDDEALDDAEASASDADSSERDTSDADSESSDTSADDAAETEAETEAEAPKPKKLKKGKKAEGAKAEKIEVIDGSPEGRELKEAQVAFEVGDYKACRALATKLAGHERPAIADGARDLLRRTDVDPAQIIFLAACLCALIGVAFYYLR